MSRELDATVVYGFVLPSEPARGTLVPYQKYLEMDFPGDSFNEEVVIYVRSASVNANNRAVVFELPSIDPEGKRQLEALARTFGVDAGWILYPTYF